ncbi:O-antigen ligase family protein [Bordetella petrii]|uniref:O-antigen ligase family protein n=1 Tax=Bordetella petrii TaxID=94624 RepID=UPI001E562786|nr:O-antigen ligase family protein [Bordetella petrii]MCD0504887.1 O-antigen ligase family protein [Bordetella petrii]
MTHSTLRCTSTLAAILVALLPILTLTVGGGSGLFYVLSLACLIIIAVTSAPQALLSLRPYRWQILTLCLPLVAALLSQYFNHRWSGSETERGIRIALGYPLLLAAFLVIDPQRLRRAAWAGAMATCLITTGIVAYLAGPAFARPVTPQFNAVGYGNLMLLVTVLLIYSLGWHLTPRPKAERILKIVVASLGLAGFVLTQTRTGWMAIPVFALIGVALAGWLRHPWRALAALLGIGLVALAIGASSPALRERVVKGAQEIQQCITVNPTANTSMCIRLQLWTSAWDMIQLDPWSGIGGGTSFSHALKERAAAGEVSAYVARDFGEPHNDILMALVTYGVPGGVALLALYFVPAWLFARRLGQQMPQAQRAAAAMGLAVCLGFAVFGLTELMFRGMRSISLYVILLALFTALSAPASSQSRNLGPE